jgi:hypothetical protein
MWVFARYWFRLTIEEFGELTTGDFWDLWEQRQVEFKRQQYLAGINASMTAAANGAHNITPFDFVGKTADEAQRDELILMFKKMRTELEQVCPERLPQAKIDCLSNLQQKGVPFAEEIVDQVFGE